MYRDTWTWDKCRFRISSLRGRLGFADSPNLKFLKLSLSLETGEIYDEIRCRRFAQIEPSVYCILSGYAESRPVSRKSELISFSQLPGGQAYKNAFIRRAVQPIEKAFGSNAQLLLRAVSFFDCERLGFGDCAVKIPALPLVPIVVILYGASSEFPASASMLFDSSASSFGSTEQLAMLGELASMRLRHAYEALPS